MQIKEYLKIPMQYYDFKSMIRFLKENKAFSAFIKNRKNYIDKYPSNFINYDKTTANYLFNETSFSSGYVSFCWDDTTEGYDFWYNLCKRIKNIKKTLKTYG